MCHIKAQNMIDMIDMIRVGHKTYLNIRTGQVT